MLRLYFKTLIFNDMFLNFQTEKLFCWRTGFSKEFFKAVTLVVDAFHHAVHNIYLNFVNKYWFYFQQVFS